MIGKLLCLFGLHLWVWSAAIIPVKDPFVGYAYNLTHRRCQRCGRTETQEFDVT